MSILKTLNELELANNSVLFHKGTRDNSNIDVYRDLNSGVKLNNKIQLKSLLLTMS